MKINRKHCKVGELPASAGRGWASIIRANRGQHMSCCATIKGGIKHHGKKLNTFVIDDGD